MGILLVWIQLILYTITLHYIYHYVPVVSHEILFLLVNSLWIPHIISYFISSFSFHSRYIPWDPHFLSLFNGHFSTLNWKHSTIYTAIFLRYIPCIALKNRLFSCGRYSRYLPQISTWFFWWTQWTHFRQAESAKVKSQLAQLSSLAGPLQNIVVQYVITRYSKQCAWYGWYIGFWWLLMVVDGCWWLLMVHGWVEIRCWWVSFRGDAGLPFARLEKARPRSFVGNHSPGV